MSFWDDVMEFNTLGMWESRDKKVQEAEEKRKQMRVGLDEDLARGEQEAQKFGLNAGEIGAGMNQAMGGLESIVQGTDVASNRMRASKERDIRASKDNSQMGAASKREMERQKDNDVAAFRAQQKMAGLSSLLNARMGQMKSARGIQGQIASLGQLTRKEIAPEAHGLGGLLGQFA